MQTKKGEHTLLNDDPHEGQRWPDGHGDQDGHTDSNSPDDHDCNDTNMSDRG